jgi:hypothetical protein
MMTSVIALNALNFFMADVRDGFGLSSACFCRAKAGRRRRSAL